jgi:hydrogenase expression/formation protein HypC
LTFHFCLLICFSCPEGQIKNQKAKIKNKKWSPLLGRTIMCLAVPGRILEVEEREGSRIARVQFGGITRPAYLDFVPEAAVGDYVMVHVGFAISRVNAEEAARTYELLEEMGLLDESEIRSPESDAPGSASEARSPKSDAKTG